MKTLYHADGTPVKIGDQVINFRGLKATVESWEAPHKEGANGYVTTSIGRCYVNVFYLFWETPEWAAQAQSIVNQYLQH